jgi:hypothetical protein
MRSISKFFASDNNNTDKENTICMDKYNIPDCYCVYDGKNTKCMDCPYTLRTGIVCSQKHMDTPHGAVHRISYCVNNGKNTKCMECPNTIKTGIICNAPHIDTPFGSGRLPSGIREAYPDLFDRFSDDYFKDEKEYLDYTNYIDELNLQIKDPKLYNRYLELKNSNTNPQKCTCVECVLLVLEKLDIVQKLDRDTKPSSDTKHISQFIFLEK